MIKVTIAETQPVFAEGIMKMLSQVAGLHLNRLISCSKKLRDTLRSETTDLLILDADLNTYNSEQILIQQLKKDFPCLKIILFGNMNSLGSLSRLFRVGLNAYLCRDISCNELIQAVTTVLQEKKYLQETISAALNCFCTDSTYNYPPFKITKREQEILELIVEEYTNQEIAAQLYISIPTVETHRKNLVSKMGVKNTAGLVREAILRHWYPRLSHGKP